MLFVTPILYDLMARFTRPRGAIEKTLDAALGKSSQPAE
jgi:multidrug efflux pump